jgi:putative mycofactocin binding protein MftB
MNAFWKKYKLAPGTQVREEDFGLLFYHRVGPRLFWVPCGRLLEVRFFQGEIPLKQWLREESPRILVPDSRLLSLARALNQLKDKGVIVEC